MTPEERLDVFRRLAAALGWLFEEEDKLPAEPHYEIGIPQPQGAEPRWTLWLPVPSPHAKLPAHLAFCGHVIEAVRATWTDLGWFRLEDDGVHIGSGSASCTNGVDRGDLALAAALAALDALGAGGEG